MFQLDGARRLRPAPRRSRSCFGSAPADRQLPVRAGMSASPTWPSATTSSASRHRVSSTARHRSGSPLRPTNNYDVRFIEDLLDLLEPTCASTRGACSRPACRTARRCRRCSRAALGPDHRGRAGRRRRVLRAVRRAAGARHRVPRHADPIVPYEGGGLNSITHRRPALLEGRRAERAAGVHGRRRAAMQTWAAHNRCAPNPVEETDLARGAQADLAALPSRHRALHRRRRRPRLARKARTRRSKTRGVTSRPRSTRRHSSRSSSSVNVNESIRTDRDRRAMRSTEWLRTASRLDA